MARLRRVCTSACICKGLCRANAKLPRFRRMCRILGNRASPRLHKIIHWARCQRLACVAEISADSAAGRLPGLVAIASRCADKHCMR